MNLDPQDEALEVFKLLARTPSADNCQPWRFASTDGHRISCQSHRNHGRFDPFGPLGHATLLSAGAMQESMEHLYGRDAGCEVMLAAERWEIRMPSPSTPDIGSPAAKALLDRHTNRLPYRQAEVSWQPPARLWPRGCRAVMTTSRDVVSVVGETVRGCSAARFNSHELHTWLFSALRWTEEEARQGDGLDVATLHLPPGGKQVMRFLAPWHRMEWMNRFGVHKIMAALDAVLVRQAPAVIAIVGGKDALSAWEAGRLMHACWISLNTAGYAVHPYYVVSDIANRLDDGKLAPTWRQIATSAVASLGEALGLNRDEGVHILLRVGRPGPAQPVRSRRLPVERLVAAVHP